MLNRYKILIFLVLVIGMSSLVSSLSSICSSPDVWCEDPGGTVRSLGQSCGQWTMCRGTTDRGDCLWKLGGNCGEYVCNMNADSDPYFGVCQNCNTAPGYCPYGTSCKVDGTCKNIPPSCSSTYTRFLCVPGALRCSANNVESCLRDLNNNECSKWVVNQVCDSTKNQICESNQCVYYAESIPEICDNGINDDNDFGPTEVFVSSIGGKVYNYDGSFSYKTVGSSYNLETVFGKSVNDMWAVGRGTTSHYDGNSWTLVANDGGQSNNPNYLTGGAVLGDSSMLIVGQGLVLDYDGNRWNTFDSSRTEWMNDVWGNSKNDFWVVGGGKVMHYLNGAWDVWSLTNYLSGIHGFSNNDIWVSGSDLSGNGVIYHYDGNNWNRQSLPTTVGLVEGVWGTHSRNMYFAFNRLGPSIPGGIIHYTPSAWNVKTKITSDFDNNFQDVFGTSNGEIWANTHNQIVKNTGGNNWQQISHSYTTPWFIDIFPIKEPLTDCKDSECKNHPACLPTSCGDGSCNGDETQISCPSDCGGIVVNECGDGVCKTCLPGSFSCTSESYSSCPQDCPFICGNGIIEGNEKCDDGNLASNDGCSSSCVAESICEKEVSGVVGVWKGEDNTDSAGYSNGILNGVTITDGKVGDAFSFDGVNDYVIIPDHTTQNLQTDLTISAWIKLSASNPDGKIIAKQGGLPAAGFKFGVYQDKIELEVRGTDGAAILNRNIAGGTILTPGVWYHVAGTFSNSGGFIKTYVNGKLDRELLQTAPILYTPRVDMVLGKESTSDANYFNGQIDELALYNRPLSDSEVASLYAAGEAGTCVVKYSPGDMNGDRKVTTMDGILFTQHLLWVVLGNSTGADANCDGVEDRNDLLRIIDLVINPSLIDSLYTRNADGTWSCS